MFETLSLIASGCLGFGIGSLVTLALEESGPDSWRQRVGRSCFQRSHLPIIGPIVALAGLTAVALGQSEPGWLIVAFGLGATAQAPILGLMMPLPSLCPAKVQRIVRVNQPGDGQPGEIGRDTILRCGRYSGHLGRHNTEVDGSGISW